MNEISNTENNLFSLNADSMEILTDMKSVASFATSFQYINFLKLVEQHILKAPFKYSKYILKRAEQHIFILVQISLQHDHKYCCYC